MYSLELTAGPLSDTWHGFFIAKLVLHRFETSSHRAWYTAYLAASLGLAPW